MRLRILVFAGLSFLLLTGLGTHTSDRAVPQLPATNPDGTIRTAGMHAMFDPTAGVVPFPNHLMFLDSVDGTVNIPGVADPEDFSDPQVVLNSLTGFSTVAPWSTTFSEPIDADSLVPGENVRVFEVNLANLAAIRPGALVPTGVQRELVPNEEYAATVASSDPTGRSLAIVPLVPLKENAGYMVALTESIKDTRGNWSKPGQPYFLAKRTEPVATATSNGASLIPLLDDATATTLEGLRVLTSFQLGQAESQGIDRDSIVLTWLVPTQSVTDVLDAVRSRAQPTHIEVASTGMTTADALDGSPGLADLHMGVVELPYYLGVPSEDEPDAPLTQFWQAPPCGEVDNCINPPAITDEDSTHLTPFNPFPVERGRQTVPVLMSVPNADSGHEQPAEGWPVMIFTHGIGGNRTNMLPLADTLAAQGVAVIAMDQPLHGVVDRDSPFYVGNTPFFDMANERHFDMDLDGDGEIDASGGQFINLASLLTSRDNLRQSQADLSVLALNIPNIDLSGDGLGDIDGARISFTGQSLGAIAGAVFLAVEPTVNHGVLNVPGGGIAGLLHGSDNIGPVIRAGLEQAGVEPFSPDYFQFLTVAQTAIDPADPVNWALFTGLENSVLLQQVKDDATVPNSVEGFPLSGTEPLIREMGLDAIHSTTEDPDGVRGAVRFIEGVHGSLLNPVEPAVTAEMQLQVGSMIASDGTRVEVNDTAVIEELRLGTEDGEDDTSTGDSD